MPRQLSFTPSALRDLAAIRDWLLQPGSGQKARAKLRHIRSAMRELATNPILWPVGAHPGVREIPVDGYRVMYEVHPDTGDVETAGDIRFLRIFGPGQDRSQM